jgi:hypothetical protein
VAPYSLLEFRVFTLKKYKANFWRGESYWDSSTVKHRGVYHWGESEVWAITTSKPLRTSWEWHKLKLLWQKWTTESPPCRTIMKKPGVYRVFKRSTQKIHCTSYIWSFSSFLHCKNGPSAQTVPILCHILSFRTTRGWSEHVRWPLTHFLSSAFSPSKNTRQIFGGVNPTEILAQWSTGGVYHWGESEVWAITTSKPLLTSWEWHKLKLLWQKWTTESPPCRTIMKKPGVYRVFKRSTQKIHCTSYIWSFSSFLHCKKWSQRPNSAHIMPYFIF